MLTWYHSQVNSGKLIADPLQAKIIERLQALGDELSKATEPSALGLLANWFGTSGETQPRSVYIHGTVGRGKSYLMDGFFLNQPRADKLRVHFHDFMRHFHHDMKKHEGKEDALGIVANELADGSSLLCFDEFHVSDIADAMVLGRILEILLNRGVVVVATSNYAPSRLYPNGLARDRFLPAIAMIEANFDICSLDGDTDYRLRALQRAGMYLHPINVTNQASFATKFEDLALGMTLKPSMRVGSRRMPAIARTSDAIWLDFNEVCGGNYGQSDYLQLATRFATVLLSGVPQLGGPQLAEETRRFTWLIDILYDSHIKVAILAEKSLLELYAGEGGESGRTLSRLQEMQSHEYLLTEIRPPQSLN